MGRKRKHPLWTFDNWDDGYDMNGYFVVYRPDYPNCHDDEGYVRRSHIVWWLTTGEIVPDGFHIHHKNRNKRDDRFSNLQMISKSDHTILHLTGPEVKSVCEWCKTEFTIIRIVERSNRKYCSVKCRILKNMHDPITIAKICPWCGKEFQARKSRGKYCSNSCSAKAREEKNKSTSKKEKN